MTKENEMTRSVIEIEYHRNGVGGTPFYAVLFSDIVDDKTHIFVATYFPERDEDGDYTFHGRGDLAIISVSRINEWDGVGHNNRWRSANWHDWIDTQIRAWRAGEKLS